MSITPNDKIERYLDELSNEYKELLYRELISKSNPLDELSVGELLRLDNEIKRPFLDDYKRVRKLKQMFFSIGMIYVLIGLIFLFLSIFIEIVRGEFQYSEGNVLALMSQITIFIGAVVIICANSVQRMWKRSENVNKSNHKLLEYKIILMWRELEGVVNDISIGTTPNTNRSIIEFLSKNHFINSADYNKLKKLLRARNSIVHSENIYTADEMKTIIVNANQIIVKLRRIV